ncbi:uncharacterized protein LOC130048032 [Ostrea edulis]|uniref:uncharacterized protein LOC130048032 n=1 Tax=Ostrea edulis TaxID=37623 RepID=UPI0024AE8EBB|nr:uncharacterized protein LOC130048032 [Ostrea edulis]
MDRINQRGVFGVFLALFIGVVYVYEMRFDKVYQDGIKRDKELSVIKIKHENLEAKVQMLKDEVDREGTILSLVKRRNEDLAAKIHMLEGNSGYTKSLQAPPYNKHNTNSGDDRPNVLHEACKNAELQTCEHLIQTHPHLLHSVDSDGWNAALYAARGGNVKLLQLLADNEVDVKHKSNDGWNILHAACVYANLEMSHYIIHTYPDLLHSVNNIGWNAALHAARGGNVKILKLLADDEVDVNYKANNGWNILNAACVYANLEMSRYIIQAYPDLLHSVDNDGWNAALHAARGGNVKILQLLADNEVDVKHKSNGGWNILHAACFHANLEMSHYIIHTYPDLLHSVDNIGWNAALHAARGGNVKILQLLADNEVDVKHKNNDGWNLLHAACVYANLEMSLYIIQAYPDLLHSVDNDGWNAALHVARGGNVKILQLLADNEVDVKHKSNDGWNILHAACFHANLEMSHYIIHTYPDLLHSVDNIGWNAALHAARGGNVKILQLLADNEVDVKHKNNYGWNILNAACIHANLEMSRYIIQAYPDLLHSVHNDGWNAALHAARGGNVKILKLLADNEVDVKHKSNGGWNILHAACFHANLEMSHYIIHTYPDLLHSVDNIGWNAALHAARGGNVKILQLLADNEVDVKHKNNYGWNILNAACIHANLEMSRYIIQAYPDLLHSVDNIGWNAALHAARGGNVKILQLLADNEVDVKHKSNDGWNILHAACVNANLEMSLYIIQAYPDLLHSVDNDGWNAALHVARGGNVKILQLLADNEVDVKHKSNDGMNILHAACFHANLEMSRYIIHTYPDLLHSVDNIGWNAALHVARGGNVKILQLLADNEVDVKHKNNDGWNILHAACVNANLEMSLYIIQAYPDLLHSVNNIGWNAALHVARGGNVKILQLLADNEVDVKHKSNDGWNILHAACVNANLEMSRYIIHTYPDLLHSVDNIGWNAALHVARGGNVKILQLLADNEVDVKHKSNDGWNILHAACVYANLEMSHYIIHTYPDLPHSVNNIGWNAALHAARGGNVKILKLLADNEVDVKHKSNDGMNILHAACVYANLEMSHYIIHTYPDLLHSVNNIGWNAALHAARGGNVKILKLLADDEVDVNYKANNGWNILNAACVYANLEMSRYIIQAYPDLLHSVDNDGWNAALHVARGGNVKILQLLADNEVDVKHKSNDGMNILHAACFYANLEMSHYIIQAYPDLLHSVDNIGWNAASHAARGGNVKILKLLADNEVDVKHKNNYGWNILHAACIHANLEMSLYIIQAYPDLLHSVDNDGWNAALHVARGGNVKILQLLADNEVDVKHKSNDGMNILHAACFHANLEMSRYIIHTYPDLLHSVDNIGWNAALHVARGGNVKILQLLADNEVDVKHKNNDGWNILHAACVYANLEMSLYIIQAYPDLLHSVDNIGWNAALHVARGGNVKILQLLADNEVDVKHKSNDGWNILHAACVNANLEMSRYIIHTYPDLLHSVDNIGWNAALHVARGGNVKILQLLADNEVDVKHKNNDGWNILHAACKSGELEMSRYIIQTYPDLLQSVDNDGRNAVFFAVEGGNFKILQLLADHGVKK